MAPASDTNKGAADPGAESPTTARPLEMDDDDVQETITLGGDDAKPTSTSGQTTPNKNKLNPMAATVEDETPAPTHPPRPMSETQKNETILKEAFPTVDAGVIKAVLSASGGRVEPAFNALLEMTDPEASTNEPQEAAPPQPPRPQGQRQMSQVEADELYARQLAEHYDNVGAYEQRTSNRGGRGDSGARQQQRQHQFDGEDREHSFFDDDLPVIKENLRQGFVETQTKVNSWIDMLKKKIEDNFDESEEPHQRPVHNYGRPGEPSRRSGDYDADPQVLSDDFAGMRFTSDGTPANRTASPRGNLRTHSSSPRPNPGRRVNFAENPEEINMYDSSPRVPPKDTPPTGGKASKWQPLSAVEPSPIGDNDPFSLGDSEDEKEIPKEDSKESTKPADNNERLKKAAAEAMADSLVDKEGTSLKKS